MNLVQYVAPTIEPITLPELKTHLRLDSETFAGNIEKPQSIAPGLHATTTLYSLIGVAIDVSGKQAVVYLDSGTNGATGTGDVKIQEYNGAIWTDWTGGAFTQITTANDNATYEKAYTGIGSQIRAVGKVLLAACEFGVSVVVNSATTSEDDDLTDLIVDGRETVERITRRRLLTQTWDYFLDAFPNDEFIKIPFGNLQSITSVMLTDSDGNDTILDEGTDYLVELNGTQHGMIVLPFGESWPADVLYPSNPIAIRFVCGWLTAAALPRNIKRAVKFAAEDGYYHGDRSDTLKPLIQDLLRDHRLWGSF